MAEPHVFLVHSRLDTGLPNFFDKAAGKSNAVLWEAEWYKSKDAQSAPWQQLEEKIRRALAVFFDKGPNVVSSLFTSNWVSWELGVAAAARKDVWVFESLRSPIFMPVPYLTDYVVYDPEDYSHVALVAWFIQNYVQRRKQPEGILTKCPDCFGEYALRTALASWNCPFCQREQVWSESNFVEGLVLRDDLLQTQDGPKQFALRHPGVRMD